MRSSPRPHGSRIALRSSRETSALRSAISPGGRTRWRAGSRRSGSRPETPSPSSYRTGGRPSSSSGRSRVSGRSWVPILPINRARGSPSCSARRGTRRVRLLAATAIAITRELAATIRAGAPRARRGDRRPRRSGAGMRALDDFSRRGTRAADCGPVVPPSSRRVALVIYTSGTTAEPKGVLHSHRTLLAEAQQPRAGPRSVGTRHRAHAVAAHPHLRHRPRPPRAGGARLSARS